MLNKSDEWFSYYYAVATFDSVEAASHVLAELEGTELERSANVFDLSFIPDEMKFEELRCACEGRS